MRIRLRMGLSREICAVMLVDVMMLLNVIILEDVMILLHAMLHMIDVEGTNR